MADDHRPEPRRGDRTALPPPAADDIDVLLEAVCAGGRAPAEPHGAPCQPRPPAPTRQSFGASGLIVRRAVGRWIAPPLAAFTVGILSAIWGLRTPEPSISLSTSTDFTTAPATPTELPSLFTLRWAEVRAAIERSMLEAATDRVARAIAVEVDKTAPVRTAMPRETLTARRRAVASEPPAIAALPDREPLRATMPLSIGDPVHAEPLLIVATPPLVAMAAASAPALERTPSTSDDTGVDEDEQAVWRTLSRYVTAFEQMNIGATVAVWPSVDRRALSRAFAALKSQGLAFDACDVDVQRTTATARCSGTVRFVPKVGSGDAQVAAQAWQFSMRRAGRDWTIDEVRASR